VNASVHLFRLSEYFVLINAVISCTQYITTFVSMESYSGRGGPRNGSVYVCKLPSGTDETMLAEYFGTIGLLKVWVLPGIVWKPLQRFINLISDCDNLSTRSMILSLLSFV